jgi:hypothetical protein
MLRQAIEEVEEIKEVKEVSEVKEVRFAGALVWAGVPWVTFESEMKHGNGHNEG